MTVKMLVAVVILSMTHMLFPMDAVAVTDPRVEHSEKLAPLYENFRFPYLLRNAPVLVHFFEQAEVSPDKEAYGKALVGLGEACLRKDEYDKAYEYFERATAEENLEIRLWSYYRLGEMCFEGWGVAKDAAKAKLFLSKITHEQFEDAEGRVLIGFLTGLIYSKIALDYGKAKECMEEAARQTDNLPVQGWALMILGALFLREKNKEQAIECYKRAIQVPDMTVQAYSNIQLGKHYFAIGNQDEARNCFQRAFKVGNACDYGWKSCLLLGDVYFAEGDFKKAKKYYEKVIRGDMVGSPHFLKTSPQVYSNLGDIYFEEKDYEKAKKYHTLQLHDQQFENPRHNERNLRARAYSLRKLGDMYYYGHGVEESETVAYEFYLKASNQKTEMMASAIPFIGYIDKLYSSIPVFGSFLTFLKVNGLSRTK